MYKHNLSVAIRCLVVEDEVAAGEVLTAFLRKEYPEIQYLEWAKTVKEALSVAATLQPNVVFLDVELPDGTGIDFLKNLPNRDFEVVFTTAHDHYAIQAIKMAALDYLLKPILIEDMINAMDHVIGTMAHKNKMRRMELLMEGPAAMRQIALPQKNEFLFINLSDILFCEADGPYTTFHCVNGDKKIVSRGLREYDGLLSGFVRAHKSYLVNREHVVKMVRGDGGYLVMKNGSSIPLSKSRKEELMQLLGIRNRF